MNMGQAPGPRMPRVKKLVLRDPVGVLSSCCTTRCVHMAQSDTRSRSRCSIPMAPPARHREKAGKLYLPAVQKMVSEHQSIALSVELEGTRVSGHFLQNSPVHRNSAFLYLICTKATIAGGVSSLGIVGVCNYIAASIARHWATSPKRACPYAPFRPRSSISRTRYRPLVGRPLRHSRQPCRRSRRCTG